MNSPFLRPHVTAAPINFLALAGLPAELQAIKANALKEEASLNVLRQSLNAEFAGLENQLVNLVAHEPAFPAFQRTDFHPIGGHVDVWAHHGFAL